MDFFGRTQQTIAGIAATVRDGFREIADAVSPGRKRARSSEHHEPTPQFQEQMAARSSQLPDGPARDPFAAERPAKRARRASTGPMEWAAASGDLPPQPPPAVGAHSADPSRMYARDAAQGPTIHGPGDPSPRPIGLVGQGRPDQFNPLDVLANSGSTPNSVPRHRNGWRHSLETPRQLAPRARTQLQNGTRANAHWRRSSFSPMATRFHEQSRLSTLYSSPTTLLAGGDANSARSSPSPGSSLRGSDVGSVRKMNLGSTGSARRRSLDGLGITRNAMRNVRYPVNTAFDALQRQERRVQYHRDAEARVHGSIRAGSRSPAKLHRPPPTMHRPPQQKQPPLLPPPLPQMPGIMPSAARENQAAPTYRTAAQPKAPPEVVAEQERMRAEAVALEERVAPIEKATQPSRTLPPQEARNAIVGVEALEQLTGYDQQTLKNMYTSPLIDMLADNPLMAEKFIKVHGPRMPGLYKSLTHGNKLSESIGLGHQHLVKIRAASSLYKAQNDHLDTARAVRREAARATLNGFGPGHQASEEPPADASYWNDEYWIIDDESADWEEEEDEDALAERENTVSVTNEKSPYAPLTPSAKKRLKQVLSDEQNGKQLMADIAGCLIYGDDLRRLRPNEWLNDEIVNSYMELLTNRVARYREEDEKFGKDMRPNVKTMNSFFYAKLYEFNKTQGKNVYDYARVRRWTRKFDVFSYDLFLVPINQHNTHWTLGVVNFKEKRVEHYDSMAGGGSARVLDNLMQWVRDEAENKKKPFDESEWEKVAHGRDVPQQANSDDCGVFLCKFADFLCRGIPLTFDRRHMNYFRSRMAHELLMQRAA